MAVLLQSRRRFIFALIACGAVLAGFGRFLKTKPVPARVIVNTSPESVPAEGALVFREERVAIVRGGNGIYALSLVCTHLGCTVSVTADGIFCPCHGSRFDQEGKVLQGPATKPLVRLLTEVRGDRLLVSS
jgi:Rieske Fe-S protein